MQTPAQAAAEKAAATTAYIGSGGAIVFGLTANELAAFVGAGVAVLGLVVQVWFKWQHLQVVRQAAETRPECLTCPEREPTDD